MRQKWIQVLLLTILKTTCLVRSLLTQDLYQWSNDIELKHGSKSKIITSLFANLSLRVSAVSKSPFATASLIFFSKPYLGADVETGLYCKWLFTSRYCFKSFHSCSQSAPSEFDLGGENGNKWITNTSMNEEDNNLTTFSSIWHKNLHPENMKQLKRPKVHNPSFIVYCIPHQKNNSNNNKKTTLFSMFQST